MLRLSKSVLGLKECEALQRVVLEDGYLGMGNEVALFEHEIAAFLDVPRDNVVCVNSGTAALHLATMALGVRGGDVLVPSLTYLASFQAISAAGLRPISCEIDPDTWIIDLKDAESRITQETVAIMPVHYASNPIDNNALSHFAAKHKLRVIEDAAHSFGCVRAGKKVGSLGDITCFSFDGIKNITSGEGGAIVSGDKKVISFVKDARLLGVINDTEKRFNGKRSWDFDVHHQGYRYHMSNLFAAIGRVQLKRLMDEFAPKRKALYNQYRDNLNNISGIILQKLIQNTDVIPHIFPIFIPEEGKRDILIQALNESGIPTGLHYKPNHLLTLYGSGKERLPITEKFYKGMLTLPLHPELTNNDVEYISSTIKSVM
jgi:dTDP-4-amino-4,6-dideoxygalactose transaminase